MSILNTTAPVVVTSNSSHALNTNWQDSLTTSEVFIIGASLVSILFGLVNAFLIMRIQIVNRD